MCDRGDEQGEDEREHLSADDDDGNCAVFLGAGAGQSSNAPRATLCVRSECAARQYRETEPKRPQGTNMERRS